MKKFDNMTDNLLIGERVALKSDLTKCGKIVSNENCFEEYEVIWDGENKVSDCFRHQVIREIFITP